MRPLSGNTSDKIMPQSNNHLITIVDINLNILKIWKISLSTTAVFLKIFANGKFSLEILIDEATFGQYIRQNKALINNPSRHHCAHQFGHLKNLKDITLHHSGFSEKFCKWEILSLNTYRWDHFQAIYQTK